MGAPCEYLSWDSEFFGHRIARVVAPQADASGLAAIHDWCTQNAIECLYWLTESDHDTTVTLAERSAFHLVDVRVTLVVKNPVGTSTPSSSATHASGVQIRGARSTDITALENIARTAHEDTRFYFDPHFATAKCAELYATWIRRSVEGYAKQVLVADLNSQAVGYITCTHDAEDGAVGSIGLVGVDASCRGRNIGPSLVASALSWFAEHGIQEVRVVTQGRNAGAQRLYQRGSFVTHSMGLWYHKWFV